MLFGKSLFQSVVDRLADEEEDEVEVPEPSFRVSGLSTSFATEKIEASPVNAGLRQDAYLFLMSQGEPVETKAPIKPPHLERLTVEQIAEDLQLQAETSCRKDAGFSPNTIIPTPCIPISVNRQTHG